MPAGTPKVTMFGGVSLSPAGSCTFNAPGTFKVPTGVKIVSLSGNGGNGNAGTSGNPGNPGNGGKGGNGGCNNYQRIVNSPGGNVNYKLYAPGGAGGNPLNGSVTNGTAGNAGAAGAAGNPSTALCKTFTGGAAGNGGSAGNAGTAGVSGNSGNGYYYIYKCNFGCPSVCSNVNANAGTAPGTGGGAGACGAPTNSTQAYNLNANCFYSGGGGGGAGVCNAAGAANKRCGGAAGNPGGSAGTSGKKIQCLFTPGPNCYVKGVCNGNSTYPCGNRFRASYGAGASNANAANAGAGGGSGALQANAPIWCNVNGGYTYFNSVRGAAGGGGGGRGTLGNAGTAGNPGTNATPASYNCVPVKPGCSYPITVGSPGGQIKISWNAQ